MKASKFLSLFILIGLFSTGLIFSNADALEYSNYYEENIGCIEFTTTAQPVVVTDGTDYEFEDGHKYLIIATTSWAGEDNSLTYEINMQHNATIFEGSQDIVEPKHTANSCDVDKKWYKYWHWVIWNPIGSQADEDISLNMVSNDNMKMFHDDSTIFVLDISDGIIENFDWFYDEVTIDEPLDDVGWNTNSSATLSFAPIPNDNEWLILGSATLSVDDIIDQFETRLNFGNGTFLTPFISKEGEDTEDQYVQSFSRVFTLNNTQAHDFKVESRTDEISVGSNLRTYNSLFALNLNIFSSHNATYGGEGLFPLLEDSGTDYDQEIMTLDIQDDATQDWYIFSSFTKESDKDMYARVQVDNVDQPPTQTSQLKQLSDNWDQSDFGMNGFGTFENLDNSTHTVDVDGSMRSGAGDRTRDLGSRSLWAFTMESAPRVFEDIIWSDNSTIVNINISPEVNATNNFVLWSDNATIGQINISQITNATDGTTFWSDFVNMTFNISQEITDTIIWSDNSTFNVDFNQDVTDDVIIWSDFTNMTFNVSQEVDDTTFWSDFINMTFNISQVIDDTIFWSDDSTGGIDLSQIVDDDVIIWSDNSTFNVDFNQDTTDDIIWSDSTNMTFNVSQEPPDEVVIWSDFVEILSNVSQEVDDTIIWSDNATLSFEIGQDIVDTVIWTDNANVTAITLSIGLPEDTVTWSDFAEMVVSFNQEVTDTVIWTDEVESGFLSLSVTVTDFVGWLDGAGQGFDDFHPPIIIEGDTIIGGSGSGGVGQPTPTIPDSDGDGFLDPDDACPNVVGTAPDGCPLVIPPVVPVPPEITLPFELSQLDVIDDNIVLDTDTTQPQVEDLTIRWLGSEPITITSVQVGDSPFEIIIEDIPVIIGNNEYGLTEYDIKYTLQEPFTLCTNDFSFDCLAEVTYDIPVIVTGEIDGKIVITEGKIRVDNSDRINPYYIILLGIFATLIIAILYFKRRRKRNPVVKRHALGKEKTTIRVINQPNQSLKAGTTRSKLTMTTKMNIINPNDRKKPDDFRYKILSEKKRKEKKPKKRNRLGF